MPIEGLEPLVEIYGYVPTFHDAAPLHLSYHQESATLSIIVAYNDLDETANKRLDSPVDIETHIRITFVETLGCNLRLSGDWFQSLVWKEESEHVVCEVLDQATGELSRVKARTLRFDIVRDFERTLGQETSFELIV